MSDANTTDALARFAGGVAHDFNNLLTIINGYSDLLLQDLPAGDPARPLIEEVLRAGERAAALARQLLAVGGRQPMTPRPIDLSVVVADHEHSVRQLVGARAVLRISLDPSACPTVADAEQVGQMLQHLASHAYEALAGGGTITVATSTVKLAAGPFVRLSVSDTGPGLASELLSRLFEPYASGSLGLAVVAGIARQAGGHASAESGPCGTTLRIDLPRQG